MPPVLHTPRLRLDDLTLKDAPDLFAYRSDAEVGRYQGWRPKDLEEVEVFIERNAASEFDGDECWYQLAVRRKGSGELVGDLGIHFIGDDGHQAEIGFTISPANQRQGLGTEAVRALLDHLLVDLGKHRVHASVDPRNLPSMALLERVGMRKEAHFRQSLRMDGDWVDDVVYAVLGAEWRGRDSDS